MDQIIPEIFGGMTTDQENETEELVDHYNSASSEQRAAPNERFSTFADGLLRLSSTDAG